MCAHQVVEHIAKELFKSFGEYVIDKAVDIIQQKVADELQKSEHQIMRDVGDLIETDMNEIKGLLKEIKLKEFHASCLGLKDALIRFDSKNSEQKVSILKDLEKALDNVRLVIKSLNSKQEALYRVHCMKIACFCFLFQMIYFDLPREATFRLCCEYINLTLESIHVKCAMECIAFKNEEQAHKKTFFQTEFKQKQMIYHSMKNVITTIIKLFQPLHYPNQPFFNFFSLFFDSCDVSHCLELETSLGFLYCVVFDNTNHQVIAGVHSRIQIWDTINGKLLQMFSEVHSGLIKQIIVLDDTLISCSDGTLRNLLMWDRKTGRCMKEFVGYTTGVGQIFVDGDKLISKSIFLCDRCSQIKIWDKNTGMCEFSMEGKFTSFYVEGDWLILQKEKAVEIWDKCDLLMHKHLLEGEVKGIGDTHIILFDKKEVHVINKRTFRVTNKVRVDREVINQVIEDGDHLVMVGTNIAKGVFSIGIWSITTGRCLDRIDFHIVNQEVKVGGKVYLCGDYLVLLIEGKLVVLNKRNLKQQRCFGEEICDFWVNEDRKEIVVKKKTGKLFHWGFHSASTPTAKLIEEFKGVALAGPSSE